MSRDCFEDNALVLKAAKYGENDCILTLLSVEHGMISVFAKSIAKSKKNRIFAQPFTYARFELKKNGGQMCVFSSAELLDSFYGLRNDMTAISVGQYLLEACLLIPEGTEDAAPFLKLTLNSLFLLAKSEKSIAPRTVKTVFEVTFLLYSGLLPNARCCTSCGNEPEFWNFDEGFLCESCAKRRRGAEIVSLSSAMLSVIRHISENEGIAKYRFSVDDSTSLRLSHILQRYMEYKFETKFRSAGYIFES